MIIRNILGLVIVFLFSLTGVLAASAGVSPAIYEVDFVPGFEESFLFNYRFDSPDVELDVLVSGDLAEYVTLDKQSFIGSDSLTATLKLPQSIDVPGPHRIVIGASPVSKDEGSGTVSVVAGIGGVIRVHVPYPGKYADVELDVKNANAGDAVPYNIEIHSRGEDSIDAVLSVEVFDSSNESRGIFPLGTRTVPSVDSIKINSEFEPDLPAGNYRAELSVSYDGFVRKSVDPFRVGELFIDVINYTQFVGNGEISSFVIDVRSSWNDPIENVYATVSFDGYDVEATTPSVTVYSWQEAELSGHVDFSDIETEEETVTGLITLHYGDGKTTETTISVELLEEEFKINYVVVLIVIGVLIVLGFFIWVFLKLRSLERHGKK